MIDSDDYDRLKRQAEGVRRGIDSDLNEALAREVSRLAGRSDWPGDVDPGACFALDEAIEAVALQLLINASELTNAEEATA